MRTPHIVNVDELTSFKLYVVAKRVHVKVRFMHVSMSEIYK